MRDEYYTQRHDMDNMGGCKGKVAFYNRMQKEKRANNKSAKACTTSSKKEIVKKKSKEINGTQNAIFFCFPACDSIFE